eukprot:3429755-Amphidinium_carterae.1
MSLEPVEDGFKGVLCMLAASCFKKDCLVLLTAMGWLGCPPEFGIETVKLRVTVQLRSTRGSSTTEYKRL